MPALLQPFSLRVLSRLEKALSQESDPWLRDDLEIAKLTVLYAARGDAVCCAPQVLATYQVLGLHPEKVWPRIFARRLALGLLDQEVAPPLKKPAQSVKLWPEKTNAAKVSGRRGGEPLLCDNTISVPMAAPSIAALFPNSDAPSSAKKRQYSLDELIQIVRYSGAPVSVRDLTLAALMARGPWPNQQGPATPVISVSIKGMSIEAGVVRSTIQRRIKRARKEEFWRRVRETNSWNDCPQCGASRESSKCGKCSYRGSRKNKGEFSPAFTYELDVEKFVQAPRCREIRGVNWRSYAEYKAAAKRGEHPNVAEWPRKPTQPAPPEPPPATAAPVKQPAAEHAHRSPVQTKPAPPKLSKTECAKFMGNVEQRKRGRTTYFSRADGFNVALHPGDEGYSLPVSSKAAFEAECAQWRRDPEAVRYALKFWGYQLQE